MTIITKKKGRFLEITNTFLQGGLINMLVPGMGLIFKYYKFKINSNINLAEYSISQTISSLSSILSFVLLGILFGFIQIVIINTKYLIIFSLSMFIFVLLFYYYQSLIYFFFKRKLLKVTKINNFYFQLQNIKNIIIDYKFTFILIFAGFIFLSILQCIAFFKALNIFGYDLNFVSSSFIYISSSILAVISMINVIGFFELALSFSASFLIENYVDIIIVGLGFRILNTCALILVIFMISLISLIISYKDKSNN